MAYTIESAPKLPKEKENIFERDNTYFKREFKYNELNTKLKYRSIELKPIKESQLG